MPSKLFGFRKFRLVAPPRCVVVAGSGGDFTPPELPQKRRIYAFTVPERGGGARCLDFADDADGVEALARHCRGDRVIKIVHGVQVDVDRLDVVDFTIDNYPQRNALPLI